MIINDPTARAQDKIEEWRSPTNVHRGAH